MPKVDEAELGDDFSYIVRIADTDIDGLKPITYGLTSVKGIGIRTSMMICKMSGIDGTRLGGTYLLMSRTCSEALSTNMRPTFLGGWLTGRGI